MRGLSQPDVKHLEDLRRPSIKSDTCDSHLLQLLGFSGGLRKRPWTNSPKLPHEAWRIPTKTKILKKKKTCNVFQEKSSAPPKGRTGVWELKHLRALFWHLVKISHRELRDSMPQCQPQWQWQMLGRCLRENWWLVDWFFSKCPWPWSVCLALGVWVVTRELLELSLAFCWLEPHQNMAPRRLQRSQPGSPHRCRKLPGPWWFHSRDCRPAPMGRKGPLSPHLQCQEQRNPRHKTGTISCKRMGKGSPSSPGPSRQFRHHRRKLSKMPIEPFEHICQISHGRIPRRDFLSCSLLCHQAGVVLSQSE